MENNDLRIEAKGHSRRAFWHPMPLQDFLENLKITREIIVETSSEADIAKYLPQYTDDVALDDLRAGKEISTPGLLFRLANGDTCPKCGHKYDPDFPALSRKDNKTRICGLCGIKEAIESIPRSHKEDESYDGHTCTNSIDTSNENGPRTSI